MSRFGLDVSSVLQFECCSRVLSKVAVRFVAIFLLASMAALTNGVPCAIAQNYIFDRGDFRVGNSPSAVIAADFNGDGRLDLAVTNESDNTVSILLGIRGDVCRADDISCGIVADRIGSGRFRRRWETRFGGDG
jgi:hypothetical protein